MSQQSKEMKEQTKNKGSVLVAESAYNSQNAQFSLVMKYPKISKKYQNKILFGLSMLRGTGADLGFSRDMADFSSTKLIFELSKMTKIICFKIALIFLEKQARRRF